MTNDLKREERVSQWYAGARIGAFYHWGLFTGGGCTTKREEYNEPLCYKTIEQFEAIANEPDKIAKNMVILSKRLGAKYITFTVVHSCGGYAVMYPTKLPGFSLKTNKDYVGALIKACKENGIRIILYIMYDPSHANSKGGPWLEQEYQNKESFVRLFKLFIDEMCDRYGSDIDGFWIDGGLEYIIKDTPSHIHSKLPHAIVIVNNETGLSEPDVDYSTTEFLSGEANPPYNRPSGLAEVHPVWGIPPAGKDFNEDIPTCNDWWYKGRVSEANQYVSNKKYLVKQAISSLGQRRKWNFALGIGPMIDGNIPQEFGPMLENMNSFMGWAAESVYNTMGGEGSYLSPGWWNDGAFGSITISLDDQKVYYVHITTSPGRGKFTMPSFVKELCNTEQAEPDTGEILIPKTNGKIISAIDLRTKTPVSFENMEKYICITGLDWEDVHNYGDKVIKVVFE